MSGLQVEFQLVMFRPFIGEVLTGKLKKCDKSGLYSMFPNALPAQGSPKLG
jgi:DNA-directed RNA polymerase subunit E'/Rpb7